MGIAGFWEWEWEGENSATKSWRRLTGTCARNVRISDISENEVEILSRKVRILYKFASEVRIWAFLWRFGGVQKILCQIYAPLFGFRATHLRRHFFRKRPGGVRRR